MIDNHTCDLIETFEMTDDLTVYDFVKDNQISYFTETFGIDYIDRKIIVVVPKLVGMILRSRIFLYQQGDLESLKQIKSILNL